jgi:hypothetical protein
VKRLHLVTEGHGDVEAAPQLAVRVLLHLGRTGSWLVTKKSSRLPKGLLVEAKTGQPKADGLHKAVRFATTQKAHALLVLVDGDEHCPARFGPSAQQMIAPCMPASAVMVVREFETWLALAHTAVVVTQAEVKRDAKHLLLSVKERYKPTVHQTELARSVNVKQLLEKGSASFDKFVREIDRLTK